MCSSGLSCYTRARWFKGFVQFFDRLYLKSNFYLARAVDSSGQPSVSCLLEEAAIVAGA